MAHLNPSCLLPKAGTTMDSTIEPSLYTYSGGNRVIGRTASSGTHALARALQSQSTGKRVFMVRMTVSDAMILGLVPASQATGAGHYPGETATSFGCYFNRSAGLKTYVNGANTDLSGTPCTSGDIAMVAVDFAAGKIWYGRNGTWFSSGNPITGANPAQTFTPGLELYPAISDINATTSNRFYFDPAYMPYGLSGGFVGWPLETGELTPFYPSILLSTRKRRAAYTGACLRIRRSSDNTEQDIGWTSDGAGGLIIDTAAITAFVGSNHAYVTKWYDQGLSARNAYQTSTALQCAIVVAGSVVSSNGRTAMRFSSSTFLKIDNCAELNFGTGDFCKELLVYKLSDGTGGYGQSRLLDSRSFGDTSLDLFYEVGGAMRVYRGTDHSMAVGLNTTTLTNLAYCRAGSTWRSFSAGNYSPSGDFTDAKDLNGTVQGIGADNISGAGLNGYIHEVRITKGSAVRTANYTAWGMS